MLHKSAFAFLAASLALAACQTNDRDEIQFANTSHEAPSGKTGALLSGWAGNDAMAPLNEADKLRDQQAENRAYIAPIGQQITWNNPDSGNAGTVTPIHDGYASDGAYCREFQQTLMIGDHNLQGHDKACQQPDGSWKIVQ